MRRDYEDELAEARRTELRLFADLERELRLVAYLRRRAGKLQAERDALAASLCALQLRGQSDMELPYPQVTA